MLTWTYALLRRLTRGPRAPHAGPFDRPGPRAAGSHLAGPDLIFRLKAWPRLPEAVRTAVVYRMLSVMSSQPVNRQWLLARTQLAPRQLDDLLLRLQNEGALEVIDPRRFAASQA